MTAGIKGVGQPIDFIAFDIQHVGPDQIVEGTSKTT
jgi:hypothetical protein